MGIEFDASELRQFAIDLGNAPVEVALEVREIVQHGAQNIKKQMQDDFSHSRSFSHLAASVSYDTTISPTGIDAEIGPDPAKTYGGGRFHTPGHLENIAYFGSSRGGGTVPDPQGALDAETPVVEKFIADVMAKVVGS